VTARDRPPDLHTDPLGHMNHLLRTPEGATAYRQRGPIAERPFAQIKHNLDIDTLHTRGLANVTNEWTFLRTTHNLRILTDHIRAGHATPAQLGELLHRARTTLAAHAA
jgi:Transposase DDE domain